MKLTMAQLMQLTQSAQVNIHLSPVVLSKEMVKVASMMFLLLFLFTLFDNVFSCSQDSVCLKLRREETQV